MEPVSPQFLPFPAMRLYVRFEPLPGDAGAPFYRLLLAVGRVESSLPAIVREGLVGLGHTMHVVLLLDRRATAIGRVQQLIRQLVDHALFATSAAVLQNPADRQRNPAV